MELSLKTRKLKSSIKRISKKARDLDLNLEELTVYGVSKEEGITVTGKDIGKNLGNYFYLKGQKFAYNPYRINIGSIGLSEANFEGLISPAYVIFEVDESIYPQFLLLYLKSSLGIRYIKWHGDRGGVRSSLRFNDLEKIDFPDMSFEEQKKFYENFLIKSKKINVALSENNKQLEYISKLRQSILQDAIQGKLTIEWRKKNKNIESANKLIERINNEKEELVKLKKIKKEELLPTINAKEISFKIPKNWVWSRLGDILLKISDGTHHSPVNVNSGMYKYVTAKNIKTEGIQLDNITYVEEDVHKEIYSRCNPEYGDILYIKDGATTGVCCINNLKEEFSMLSSVALLKASKNLINNFFLLIALRSPFYYDLMRADMSGVAITRVTLKKLKSSSIPLPPIEEQNEIVNIVSQFLSNCDSLESEVLESKMNSEKLIQSMISELFGEEKNFNLKVINTIEEKKKNISLREVKYNNKTILMEIVELLKIHGKLHAEDLWKMSKHYDDKNINESIDKFYADLKDKVEIDKTIKEVANDKGYIELV